MSRSCTVRCTVHCTSDRESPAVLFVGELRLSTAPTQTSAKRVASEGASESRDDYLSLRVSLCCGPPPPDRRAPRLAAHSDTFGSSKYRRLQRIPSGIIKGTVIKRSRQRCGGWLWKARAAQCRVGQGGQLIYTRVNALNATPFDASHYCGRIRRCTIRLALALARLSTEKGFVIYFGAGELLIAVISCRVYVHLPLGPMGSSGT